MRNKPLTFIFTSIIVVAGLLLPGLAANAQPATPANAAVQAPDAGETCQVVQPGPAVALDSFIKQEKQDERLGTNNELKIKTESNKLMRSLLKFDLSFVPAGAFVTSATLSLWVKEARDGNATISAHQVTAAWNEAEVTWKARDKAAALLWTNLGGDYNATALSSHNVVKDVKNYWATWNVTAAAANWVAAPASNFGVLLESPVTSPRNETKFKSSDDGTTSQRPKLEVCYSSGAIQITPDNSGQAVAGQTKTYSHTVSIGNQTSAVNLSATSSKGWTTRIYRDLNSNGQLDAGEPQISQIASLGPNASAAILVQVDIPAGVAISTVDYTTVTATAVANGTSDTARDTTRVGSLISVKPNGGSYATAGSAVFYTHYVTNNGATADQITVSAISSQGWQLLLWEEDRTGAGVYTNPLVNPLSLAPGQSYPIVVEVRVPAGATAGTTDRTAVRAASTNEPGVTGVAVDTTEVFVNAPPVMDGKYDQIYQTSPDAHEVCYVMNGQILGRLASFSQPAGDSVYMVLALDKAFVDNTYGTNAIGWPSGHDFGDLVGSDKAQFYGYDANDVKVLDFEVDYVTAKTGAPSGYASLGVSGGEGGLNLKPYATVASFPAWGTSIDYSLNATGYCSGGACSAGGTNLLVDSPATNEFYTPNANYPNWIYDVIYEIQILKSAFGPAGYGSIEIPYVHASPSKAGTNTLTPEPVPCDDQIGDFVWHDLDHNAIQDPGEPGIDGVQVKLYADSNGDGVWDPATDQVVATKTTTNGGRYLFQTILAGDYFVKVVESTVPSGYVLTTDNDPTPLISLAEGQSYLQADFGYTEAYGEVVVNKTLLTPSPIYVGQEIEFAIEITNAGSTLITKLPLEDYYDPAVLEFISATPAPVSAANDGVLNWSDLTASFGHDLGPGDTFTINARFRALQPTKMTMSNLASAAGLAAEPVVDGLLESEYTYVGQLSASDAGGPLYTYKGANLCYYAFMLDRRYNSNVYADSDPAYMALFGQTSTRHKFGDLLGSDNFTFNLSSPGGNYTNLGLDLLSGTTGAWLSGQTGKDGSKLPGATVIADAMTSLEWNLENSGWTDLTHSPAYDYNQTSGDYWEWNIIYEWSIPLSKLGNSCGTVSLVSAHTSPGVYESNLATIGDRVWADADEDKIQDTGEVGLPGVVVNLYQGSTLVRTTETAPGTSGYYIFGNLAAGTYTVNVDESTLPEDWVLTTANEPKTVTVTAGQNYDTADFGYWESGTASIGDRVWYDLNGDGAQDAGEPGINGVTVNLYSGACGAGGLLKKTIDTTGNGDYDFTKLPAGTYCADVDDSTLPAGYTLTSANKPQTVPLADGQDYNDADFGYLASCPDGTPNAASTRGATDSTGTTLPDVVSYACADINSNPGAVGDFLWYDADGNGVQDVGEPGIANVTLDLYRNGVKVASTVTDADGGYLFPGLPPGNYSVDVTDLYGKLATLIHSMGEQSQPDPTPNYVLAAGEVYKDADFGYLKDPSSGKAVIGDTVWYDDNGDGIQQPNEPGIPGVTVVVFKSGASVAVAVTDSNGHYLLQVDPGSGYTVAPVASSVPSGLSATTPVPAVVPMLNAGDAYLGADFGYDDGAQNLLGEIGNLVWLDANQNGIRESGEGPLAGVSVDLIRDSDGGGDWDAGEPIIATVTTGSALDAQGGNYLFTGLPQGKYLAHVSDTNAVLTDFSKSPVASGTDQVNRADPYAVNLAPAGANNITADFGYYQNPGDKVGVIGNQVWIESIPNGLFDPLQGDFGQPGVTVDLLQGGQMIATTTTGASGDYSFVHVPAGNYQVQVSDNSDVLSGLPVTVLGPNQSQDHNNQLQPYSVSLPTGGYNVTADFGYLKPPMFGILGDLVWYDSNHDAVQNIGEPGIPNVRLALYLSMDGNNQLNPGTDRLVGTTVTDADGGYIFTLLQPAVYFVDVMDAANPNGPLNGMIHSQGVQSLSDATPPIPLAGGAVYKDADFGYYRTPSDGTAFIGDTVWYDDNGDGVQQPSEPGIPGVTVFVNNDSGTRLGQAVTDNMGHYLIEVPVGNGYTANVDAAASSTPLAGLSPTTMQPHGLPPLSKGQQFLGADFGYDDGDQNLLGEVGNLVWHDTDRDGAFDTDETPLAGVSVDLIRDSDGGGDWDAGEPIIATVTTGSALDAQGGNYRFTGVPQGRYLVHVSDTNAVLVDFTKSALGDQNADQTNKADPYSVTLAAAGANEYRADFGYYQNPGDQVGYLGNQVWIERQIVSGDMILESPDGVFDDRNQSDTGQIGVTVDLLQNGQVIATTTTGASGDYSFLHLPEGEYQVQVSDVYGVLTNYSPSSLGPNPGQDNNNQEQPYSVNLQAPLFGMSGPSLPDAAFYNLTADFAYTDLGGTSAASYTIIKRLNGASPVRLGEETSFTIQIINTSQTAWITYLPMRDVYDTTYLAYLGATPASLDNVNDGVINWRDLTETLGDIAPLGGSVSITVRFTAIKDTMGSMTENRATVYNAWADADGPTGPEASALALPEKSSMDDVEIRIPTVVEVAGFSAAAAADGVTVAWETTNELNVAGFLLLRRTAEGDLAPVNSELIVAQHAGADSGASYTFLDTGAPAGPLTYVLQVLRLDGRVEALDEIEIAR